ncbi:MAG: Cyclic di-GMP phosphodiesterase Gmr [Firmicutes bacterium ADurb.Bin193]|nr:MAG: Cyclic di-GMP phosphodiesterase Gmr [Firmicutes bacterium ADurb.Bin193]
MIKKTRHSFIKVKLNIILFVFSLFIFHAHSLTHAVSEDKSINTRSDISDSVLSLKQFNQHQPDFTDEEIEYIAKSKKIRAVYDPNWFPFEYTDTSLGVFSGASASIFELISIYSGLEFEFIPVEDANLRFRMVNEGYADVICGVLWGGSEYPGLTLTKPYCECPLVLIGNYNTVIDEDTTLLLSQNRSPMKSYINSKYPNLNIDTSHTISECIEIIKTQNNAVLVANSYTANAILLNIENKALKAVSITNDSYPISIGLPYNANPVLLSILNKSVSQISESDKNHLMLDANALIAQNISVFSILKMYFIPILISLITLILSFIAMCVHNKRKGFKNLMHLAFTDPLTGGDSLAKFKSDAEELFSKNGTSGYSIVSLDIDRFKYINDIYGYTEGDNVLRNIHSILNSHITEGELCARVSSDWFVLLLRSSRRKVLTKRIETIFDEVSRYKRSDESPYNIVLKCGIYIASSKDSDINIMLDKAFMTRGSVKPGHKSALAFYSDSLKNRMFNEKAIENQMQKAVENNEFIIYLQPKYDLKTYNISGAEALVRWRRTNKDIMNPEEFIPIFERNGFIILLDLYVFESVCKQIRKWIDRGSAPIKISSNISRVNLTQPDFIEKYKAIIEKYNVPPEYLELELTESAILENYEALEVIVDKIKKMGVSISIDDFGSGYSSLSIIATIPIDTLKIDRNFILKNYDTANGRIVIKKIVELAKELKLTVVTEGVETMEQEDFLRSIGCDIAQGFMFSAPVPINDFNRFLSEYDPQILKSQRIKGGSFSV